MAHEAGWAQIIEADRRRTVGRGRLRVDTFDPLTGDWRGHLDAVRQSAGMPPLQSGEYRLALERYAEECLVRLEPVDRDVHVIGADGILPAPLTLRPEAD